MAWLFEGGEREYTVDAKGRVTVPPECREVLGESFVITRGKDGCLSAHSLEQWEHIEKWLETDEARAPGTQRFYATRQLCTPDAHGRITISQGLRRTAKITNLATFISTSQSIEIWASEVWQDYIEQLDSGSVVTYEYDAKSNRE